MQPERASTPRSTALVAAPQSRAQLLAAGLTASQLRSGRFRRVLHDVYVSRSVPVSSAVLRAGALVALPQAVLSHESAADVHGLPLPLRHMAGPVSVTTPVAGPPGDYDELVVHVARLPDWQVIHSDQGPVTSAARTFLDLARVLDRADLVAFGDAALHRRLATVADLETVIEWGAGRRGVVSARRALLLLDGRAASAMETKVRLAVRDAGFPRPEINAAVVDADGEWLAEGDVVFRRARVVVDFDGRVHLEDRQRRADLRRINQLTAAGWVVLRLTADDVLRRPELWLSQLRQLLDDRDPGWRTRPRAW